MGNRIFLASVGVLLGVSACGDTRPDGPTAPVRPALTASSEVPQRPTTGREGHWEGMSDEELWGHIVKRDSAAIPGLKDPAQNRGVWRKRVLISTPEREQAIRAVRGMRGVQVLSVDTLLTRAKIKIQDLQALSTLRRLGFKDYLEPNGGGITYLSESSGCAYNTFGGDLTQRTFAGDYLPPNYSHPEADIDVAWNRARGDGVVLGLTDTGISADQYHATTGFATSHSAGRWYSYHGVQARPWYETNCSHGNRMASSMAAPMNGSSTVGVAWRANLVSAHQSGGTFTVDADDAAAGIRIAAAANADVAPNRRIVTMAFQADNWFSMVSDEIRYWHANGRLFIGASGTVDYAGVAFPADMQEVMAVSAVGSYYEELDKLNYGDDVEVSFFVNQLAHGKQTDELTRLGGSSGATAVISGIAALVWSHYPSESNEQIRDRLRRAGHQYPNHDRVRGYGVVDAMRAVGGLWRVWVSRRLVSGGGFNELAVYELEATPMGGDGPYTFQWNTGETTSVIHITIGPGDPNHVYTVDVTDPDPYGTTVNRGTTTISAPAGGCADPGQIICQ